MKVIGRFVSVCLNEEKDLWNGNKRLGKLISNSWKEEEE